MAESLGAAVLTVSVDDAQLKAGLQAAERSAQVSGQNIQQAFTRSGRSLQTASNGIQFYIDAQGRARNASGQFLSVVDRQAAGLDKLGGSATGASTRVNTLTGSLVALGTKAAATIAILETVRRVTFFASSQITELNSASAAVQTLGVDTDELKTRLRALSVELNNNVSQIQLTKSAYDVASSGFSSAAEATSVLRAAALGAKGGFADINDVAGALTGVLNAYGLSASEATGIVDKFIQTQADGVITVRQYAAEIGNVSSIAAASGVSIEELNAAIATATLRGVPVSQTFTGLRQAIASIIKPSEQAKELASQLGIDYSVAALQSKGFAGVLSEVQEKTGGAAEKIAVLVGSVEAQAAIQPLLNDNLAKYNELLANQANAAGQAASASEINAKTISGGLAQIGNGFSNLATTLDSTLSPLFAGFISDINSILVKLNQVSALAPDKVQARERQATEIVGANLGPLGIKGSGFFGPVTVPGASVGPQFAGIEFTGSAIGVREDIIKKLLEQDIAEINSGLSSAGEKAGQNLADGGTKAGESISTNAVAAQEAINNPAAFQAQQQSAQDVESIRQQGNSSTIEAGNSFKASISDASQLAVERFDQVSQKAVEAGQALAASQSSNESLSLPADTAPPAVFDNQVFADLIRAANSQVLSLDSLAVKTVDLASATSSAKESIQKVNAQLPEAFNKIIGLQTSISELASKNWEVTVNVDANTGTSEVQLG